MCPPDHQYLMKGLKPAEQTKVTLLDWANLQQEHSAAQTLYDTKARMAVLTDLVRQ